MHHHGYLSKIPAAWKAQQSEGSTHSLTKYISYTTVSACLNIMYNTITMILKADFILFIVM